MSANVDVARELFTWAKARSRRDEDYFLASFPKLPLWETGQEAPTLVQLEKFAHSTYTPIGFFFLASPPKEMLPVSDFRTMNDEHIESPSPNLLDTIAVCEQRQAWYRNYLIGEGSEPVQFVGSLTMEMDVNHAASKMAAVFDFGLPERRDISSWEEALRSLADHAEAVGILVMISGVVENNTHRPLDPEEFRGFSLSDSIAPLVFVNGADSKAAQIFTLAHELAHIGLGQSALSNSSIYDKPSLNVERWCNNVAVELLVPLDSVRKEFNASVPVDQEVVRLARKCRVSTWVILRRLRDSGYLSDDDFWVIFELERSRLSKPKGDGGGNFYNTLPVRVGKRFARALIGSALSGRTQYKEAFSLLGFSKTETLEELGYRLGVA